MSSEQAPDVESQSTHKATERSRNTHVGSALLRYACWGLALVVLALLLGGIEQYHVARLRWLGADIIYGPKGGYFVTLPPGSAVTDFLRHGAPALDYLSRRFHTTIRLDKTQVSDSDLQLLESVQGDIFVSLKSTGVTDAAIQSFHRMARLSGVDLSDSQVSDEAISALWRAKHWRRAEPVRASEPRSGHSKIEASSGAAR
jgi:hypothetical protein